VDNELIKLLRSGKRAAKKSRTDQGYAIIRTKQGLEKVALSEVEIPQFHGRVGTTRRSSKGRTYRAPNGRRYYVENWDNAVVSYKV
jgi:hypothetical protein